MDTGQTTTTYFDHYSRGYKLTPDGRRLAWHEFKGNFRALLPANKGARILDFGCGAGLILEWLAAEGFKNAEGVDLDPGQIQFAQSLGLNVRLVDADISWLGTVEKFDVVMLTDVLEHIPPGSDLALLGALRNALKPEGRLIIRVPNANSSFEGRYRYIDPTHHRSYTEESLWYDLHRSGFRAIEIKTGDVWWPRTLRELLRMAVLSCFRAIRRLETLAEFGFEVSRQMPISLTLIAIASMQGADVSGNRPDQPKPEKDSL